MPRYGPLDALAYPRFEGISTFMRLPHVEDLTDVDAAIVGVPFDTGVTYRSGARFGPQAVRAGSRLLRPYNVVQQVEPLRKLVDARQRLSDLLSKMDGNDKLETILNEIASDTNAQAQLSSALGLDKPSGETPAKEESK